MSDNQIVDTPENWDLASKGYSENIAPVMMDSFMDEFIDQLEVDNTMEAIELASGSGAMTEPLSRKVKSLLATDFSPKMIEVNKNRIKAVGINNVSFDVMDGQNLTVSDESFDRSVCSFGIMLFPDRSKGFSELKRVLRPGGRTVVSGWSGPDKFEAFGLFMSSIMKAFPDFPKPDAPPPVFSLADLGVFKNEMEAAGFKNVETAYVSRQFSVENADAIWKMLSSGAPPVKLLFDKVGEEGKMKVREALEQIVQERFGNGKIEVTNAATVGVGTV